MPACGGEVGVWRWHDKKLAKASDLKVHRDVDLWGDGTCFLLKKGCDPEDPQFTHGLRPKSSLPTAYV